MNSEERKTILLVEDEVLIAMDLGETLQSFGYNVIIAHTGPDAIEAATKNLEVSLILMDINLGRGMDGTESAKKILAVRQLPIIFLSSHAEKEMVEKVRGFTRYGYVTKNAGDFVLQVSIEMAYDLFDAHRDIQRHMKALKESEEKFSTIFHFSPIAMTINSLADGRYRDVNAVFLQAIGYTHAEVVGNTSHELGEFKSMDDRRYLIDTVLQEGSLYGMPFIARTKDGKELSCLISAAIISIAGEKFLLSAIVDISDRQKAEDAMKRQIEELKRFSKITSDRELRMIELKKEINDLRTSSGKKEKYQVVT
jgi:two-component system, sensor histidine kinase PdtaS